MVNPTQTRTTPDTLQPTVLPAGATSSGEFEAGEAERGARRFFRRAKLVQRDRAFADAEADYARRVAEDRPYEDLVGSDEFRDRYGV